MRAMPFRVAGPETVTFERPMLTLGSSNHEPGEPVAEWDYLSAFSVSTTATIHERAFLEATGLESANLVVATMQLDCPSTGFRALSTGIFRDGRASLVIDVAAHQVAMEVEVRLGVVLAHPTIQGPSTVAHKKGSRLHTESTVHRFPLEGTGGGFPTEAFDFAKIGYPAGAAWRLNLRADSLDEPFSTAVRLQINTGHPRASDMLSGSSGLVQSIVFHGVLEQMLLAVADASSPDTAIGFEEGSLGYVLDELTDLYLGLSLEDTLDVLKKDRSRVLAKLQEATGFMEGATK